MKAAHPFLPTIAICLGMLCWSPPARADYFSTWIAASCDASKGRAAIRFGYADADDPPLFIERPEPAIGDGFSHIPVVNASQKEAACILKDGKEVKVRLGTGYGEGDQYSVWIDRRKVVHGEIAENNLPYELLIYPSGFRLCTFVVSEGGLYDVTSAGQKPTAIRCDPSLTPLDNLKLDLIEYPVKHGPKPIPETIRVSKGNFEFCRQLIHQHTEKDGTYYTVEDPREIYGDIYGGGENVGTTLSALSFPDKNVNSVQFDIWNTGHPTRVFTFDSGGTFTDEFLVIPAPDTPDSEVVGLPEVAGDFQATAEAARRRGWTVYSSSGTPFEYRRISISLLRVDSASYLLYQNSGSNPNPIAVLMKPTPEGKVTKVCVFDLVHAHF